ncbi:hypothetical protein KQR54_18695 [Mycobacterium gordonae]|nr:hypothetical protein [Mycobacterium gordonae]
MHIHAQLDDEGLCIGYGNLSGIETNPLLVYLSNGWDPDLLWRKYENGEWSAEKFEPEIPEPGPSLEDQLNDQNQRLSDVELALADLFTGGM